MLLHVLISLLTRLRLKFFKTCLLHLGWLPRDYRAVVHEENWANCPFKRKLYCPGMYLIIIYTQKSEQVLKSHFLDGRRQNVSQADTGVSG